MDALGERDYEEVMSPVISEIKEQNPGVIAERLLQFAICAGRGHIRDDMTVLVTGIWNK